MSDEEEDNNFYAEDSGGEDNGDDDGGDDGGDGLDDEERELEEAFAAAAEEAESDATRTSVTAAADRARTKATSSSSKSAAVAPSAGAVSSTTTSSSSSTGGGGGGGGRGRRRAMSVSSMSEADLVTEIDETTAEISEVLSVSNDMAAALLHHYKWNKMKLLELFPENPDKIKREAGLTHSQTTPNVSASTKKVKCPVCLDDVPPANTFALGCAHRYCKPCLSMYLQSKVADGVVTIRCAFPRCSTVFLTSTLQRLLPAEIFPKLQKNVVKSYISENPHMKPCPFPGCPSISHVERITRTEPITCAACSFTYCFRCNDHSIGDHQPATCAMTEAWIAKATDQAETVTWLMANTKNCPKCRSAIEKNGGCMHMTCRKTAGGCGHEFCWLCRGPWSEHGSATGGYYSCNKYDASSAKKEDLKSADLKTEMEHYMFYYHRYDAHQKAKKIAQGQLAKCSERELALAKTMDIHSTDTKFLYETAETLIHCRQVLEYSYVFGFNLPKTSRERALFEHLQEDLEKYTNHLTELYEQDERKKDYQAVFKWKEEVTNYMRVTLKFLSNFNAGVASGLTG